MNAAPSIAAQLGKLPTAEVCCVCSEHFWNASLYQSDLYAEDIHRE